MSDLLKNAKEHFANRLAGEMQFVLVPEWSDDKENPDKIFYKPMTLLQQNKIFKFANEGSLESIAMTLIIRSLNEDGKPHFRIGNMTEIMRMFDPQVIERVVMAMSKNDDLEEIEKNSEGILTEDSSSSSQPD